MTQAERDLDRLKELERDGSQYNGELLRERSSKQSTPSGQTTPSWTDIQSSRADTSSWEIDKFKRRWDCSQNQSWRAADHVTRMEKTLEVPELITIYSHLQRCWIWTPDSITSDRIWCRYQNGRLLNQRNSPPGKYDPRSHLQRTLADITIRRSKTDRW